MVVGNINVTVEHLKVQFEVIVLRDLGVIWRLAFDV
jgi:hypothetical protein